MKIDTPQSVDSPPLVSEVKKKKVRYNWLSWLVVLGLLGGIGYAIYYQVTVVPSQQARRRVLTRPVQRQSLAITVSANGTVEPERSINLAKKFRHLEKPFGERRRYCQTGTNCCLHG